MAQNQRRIFWAAEGKLMQSTVTALAISGPFGWVKSGLWQVISRILSTHLPPECTRGLGNTSYPLSTHFCLQRGVLWRKTNSAPLSGIHHLRDSGVYNYSPPSLPEKAQSKSCLPGTVCSTCWYELWGSARTLLFHQPGIQSWSNIRGSSYWGALRGYKGGIWELTLSTSQDCWEPSLLPTNHISSGGLHKTFHPRTKQMHCIRWSPISLNIPSSSWKLWF